MWHDVAIALCLVFVLEGLLPFISPRHWRHYVLEVASMDDRHLRAAGLISMIAGVGLLYWVN